MPFTYGGFNFDDGVNTFITEDSDYYAVAPRQHQRSAALSRPGGVLALRPPGAVQRKLAGQIRNAPTGTGAMETIRDAMLAALAVPKQRLIDSNAGTRYLVATPIDPFEFKIQDFASAKFAVTFEGEDAYESAILPSGDSRTPTLALLPSETIAYGQSYSLTPGGNAPAPLRILIANQSGGVTPALWQVTNLATRKGLAITAAVPAGSAILIDPQVGVFTAPMAGVVGYWPFTNSASPALDFTGASHDLTATGTPSYLQDGPLAGPAIGFPGTTGSYLASTNAAFAITGTLSVGAWVYATSIPAVTAFLSKAAANLGYSLQMRTAGFAFGFGGSATSATLTGTTAPVAATWYFVVATYSASQNRVRLYVGTESQAPRLEAQAAASPVLATSAGDFRIGAGHDLAGTVQPLNGRVATPAVLTAELTLAQIIAVWLRGPQAAFGQAVPFIGEFPSLDPGAGATNLIQVRADSGTGTPTVRASVGWRSRYA